MELGILIDSFREKDTIDLYVEESGLTVTFEKNLHFHQFNILSNSPENKTLTICSKPKQISQSSVILNELALNNIALNYSIAKGQGNFQILKRVTIKNISTIEGFINDTIDHKTHIEEKLVLTSSKGQIVSQNINNGYFLIDPFYILSPEQEEAKKFIIDKLMLFSIMGTFAILIFIGWAVCFFLIKPNKEIVFAPHSYLL
jgi:hypothetical protein